MTLRALLLLAALAAPWAPPAEAQPVKGGTAPAPSAPAPSAPAPTARPAPPELPRDLLPCTRLEGATADPNAREAERTRALLRDGRVATVVLDLPGGAVTRTDFTPGRRDGTSLRLLAFPRPGGGAAWNTVFNHATVQPDGTILIETWLGYTDRAGAPPVHNWYRLRCEAGPASPAAPGGSRPGPKG